MLFNTTADLACSVFSRRLRKRHRRKNRTTQPLDAEVLEDRQLLTVLSDTGIDDQELIGSDAKAYASDVAHNVLENEYLVVWRGTGDASSSQQTIWGRLVSDTGVLRRQFQIGADDYRQIGDPSVTWNATDNEYRVAWSGAENNSSNLEASDHVIYTQRVTESGDLTGLRHQIGDVSTNRIDVHENPDVVWNSTTNDYLIAYRSNSSAHGLAEDESEVFVHRFRNGLSPQTSRISDINGTGTPGASPVDPKVVINTNDGEYFVTWVSQDDASSTNPDGDRQVFGQRLTANGDEIGVNDRQLSRADEGTGYTHAAAFNAQTDQYLVTWDRWDWDGNGEFLFGQLLESNGARSEAEDFQISKQIAESIKSPSIAWNSQNNEFLITWNAAGSDRTNTGEYDGEVFGQRLDGSGIAIGYPEFRISNQATDNDQFDSIGTAATVWNSRENEFFVTWSNPGTSATHNRLRSQRLLVEESMPIDLSSVLNADVIHNRRKGKNDSSQHEGDGSGLLQTQTYASKKSADGNGLPNNGYFPGEMMHPSVQLPYRNSSNAKNAVALIENGDSFTVNSYGYFSRLYLYGFATTNGNVEIQLRYNDGTTETQSASILDWETEASCSSSFHPIATGLDYTRPNGSLVDSNDRTLSGYRFNMDPSKELRSITVTRTDDDSGELYVMGLSGLGHAPENIVVTTLEDEADGDMSKDDISLREAVYRVARNRNTTDTITFDPSLNGGTIDLNHGHLRVFGNAEITGPGADKLTIDGQGESPHFDFASQDYRVSLKGMSLENGWTQGVLEDAGGGSIRALADTFIRGVAFRDNVADFGGAIVGFGQSEVTVYDSEFTGNRADTHGGAISADGLTYIKNTTFSDNETNGAGGAVYVRRGDTRLRFSTILNNRADANGTAAPIASILGIGGGVATSNDGIVSLRNTVVALNTNGAPESLFEDDIKGTFNPDSSYSAIGAARGAGAPLRGTNNNLVGYSSSVVEGWFGPFQNNGGPTSTYMPTSSSPLVNVGGLGSSQFDQRGLRRNVGPHDIGAVERETRTLKTDGVLYVYGSADADTITLKRSGNSVVVERESGSFSTPLAGLTSIQIWADSGNDTIRINDDFGVELEVNGEDGRDLIVGGAGDESLFGGDGNDTIRGNDGDDYIVGNAGHDSLVGGDGKDELRGLDGNDHLDGGSGADILDGGNDNDYVKGGNGSDLLHGNRGDDVVNGGRGADTLTGGYGSDTLNGGSGRDFMEGGYGNDSLKGGSGADIMLGTEDNDILFGGSDRDVIIGGHGGDTLRGQGGDDLLIAGTTLWDTDDDKLKTIRSHWESDEDYGERIDLNRDDQNGNPYLNPVSVNDDTFEDDLRGNSGRDWFFARAEEISDIISSELNG